MKRSELIFSAILVPVDFLMVVAAGFLSYALRFSSGVTELRPVLYELPLSDFLPILFGVGTLWVAVFAIAGLYALRGTKRVADEVARVFTACSTAVLLVIIIVFFQREFFSSRFIVLTGWLLTIVTTTFGRLVVRGIQHAMFRSGIGVLSVVIVGQGKTTDDLVRLIYRQPEMGYRIAARYEAFDDETLTDLEQRLAMTPFDEIIQAESRLPKEQTLALLEFANDRHLTFRYAADLFEAQTSNVEVASFAGVPFLEIKRTPLDGWGKILKRVFDLLVGALLLIVLSPVLFLVALMVRLDSQGSSIVSLERIGEHGRRFRLYKFRSMVKNAQELKPSLTTYNERNDGPLFKMKNDPRITRVGRLLRKTSLDELPQLVNVVLGQMSLVGPRPHEPEEVARYEQRHRKLLSIKPGITGMAQVSGRSDLSFEEEFRLDVSYIEHWSLRLDLQVLLKTLPAVLSRRAAA